MGGFPQQDTRFSRNPALENARTAGKPQGNRRGLQLAGLMLGDIESEFQFALRKPTSDEGNIKMTLDRIPRGITALVTSVEASDTHGLRLMEMGVVPGAEVRVVKSAPLGDPIQVCVRNYHLALRRAEAKSITVTFTKE